ncbi:MAG: PAS domain-containing protein [Desulfobacterales bacterium]|nr:PAS domain-containing protein [Desulfobacterales bacterium]
MRKKRLYLPAITILATVLTLIVLLSISTFRNLHRERVRMEESLLRDGTIVLRSMEASFRSGITGGMGRVGNLQWLMSEISTLTDIRFISIVEESGLIIAHSAGELAGASYPQIEKLRELKGQNEPKSWFDTDGQFLVAKRFQPVVTSRGMRGDVHGSIHSMMHSMMVSRGGVFGSILSGKAYAIVGLDTRIFDEARRSDVRHAIMMGLILLVLGSASLYFVFLIQNYYIVNRTLNSMTTYTTNVVGNMPDGVISIDDRGEIVTVNNRAREIFGLVGVPDERIELKKRFLTFVAPLLESLKHKKRVLEREIECLHDDGKPIPLSVSGARLISEDGEDLGAVFILRDMREIKELEDRIKRSERLASMGSLAAGMAHEIRNPLSSIKGFAQFFLKKTIPGTEDHKYSGVMIKEVDRLNRVISNLLDFARPKEPLMEKTSITDLINHGVGLIHDDAKSKDIQVMLEIKEDIPDLELDRDQITQVLLNIELNGLNAMQEGGKLWIRCFRGEDANVVIVEIEDTGHGIPEDELSKIFDPFYTTKKRGTGLGLAIAHRIVENHSGTLSVRSKKGSGTVFRIELPIS